MQQESNDPMYLLSSAEIAKFFLDQKQLKDKRPTSSTISLPNLMSTDVAWPLKDIDPNFTDDTILEECRLVLESTKSLVREIQTDERRYYLRRILPYRTTDNHVGGVVISFVDITHRKTAETLQEDKDARHFVELQESAERLQAILNTTADSIITIDLLGKIRNINSATERFFQYKRDELIGENIALLMPVMFDSDRALEGSHTTTVKLVELVGNRRELVARRKDGSTFPVDLALSRVDHLGLYTGILRDITVQKQLQAHILEIATDEQSRIGQELHDGTQQELTGMSLFAGAIEDFLNNATHRSDKKHTEWILRDIDYQRIKQTLAKLTHSLIQASHNVHELSHGIMPVQIDAEGLWAALADLASSANANPKFRCKFEFVGSGSVGNKAASTQLFRIAQEALTNSQKHGKASEIRISLILSSAQTVLEISDNGLGFEPIEKTETFSEGGGLGLRIMQYRASILGGELQVSRNNRNGTTVRCTIPTLSDLK
ncbi:MAG: PAS domain S-box protein [Planctomycetota bacterium]|nr:PAS domain S-box protein [Planctomycetota bacterium]